MSINTFMNKFIFILTSKNYIEKVLNLLLTDWSMDMKNIEKKVATNSSHDEKYSKSRISTFNKNYYSEIKFIVPWIILDKYGSERDNYLTGNKKL